MNRIVVLTFVVLAASSSPLFAKGAIDLPLDYRPTNTERPSLDITGMSAVTLSVGGVADERGKGSVVGINVEDDAHDEVVAKNSVTDFVSGVVSKEIRTLGVKIGGGGGKELVVAIQELWVEESSIYKGQAQLRFTLTSGGKELWAGVVSGSSTRWGRSRSRDNYNEVLSDSLMDAVMRLLENEAFRAALRR